MENPVSPASEFGVQEAVDTDQERVALKMTQKAKISTFSGAVGEKCSVTLWIRELEWLQRTQLWTSKEVLRVMHLHLRGDAAAWAAEQDKSVLGDLDSFKAALERNFSSPVPALRKDEVMRACQQRDEEAPSVYLRRLRALARDRSIALNNDDLLRYFVAGLRLELAERRAHWKVGYQRGSRDTVAVVDEELEDDGPSEVAVPNKGPKPKAVPEFEQKLDRLTERVAALSEEVKKMSRRRQAFPDECFNCHERGHHARDCPRPKQPGRARKTPAASTPAPVESGKD